MWQRVEEDHVYKGDEPAWLPVISQPISSAKLLETVDMLLPQPAFCDCAKPGALGRDQTIVHARQPGAQVYLQPGSKEKEGKALKREQNKVTVKIADSSAVNKKFLLQFRAYKSLPAVDFLTVGFISDPDERDPLCSGDLKQQICGRDCALALYSEKKAAANKGLRNKNVEFLMLEEPMYSV